VVAERPGPLAVADLDGDGRPDVVAGDVVEPRFAVLFNRSGDFEAPRFQTLSGVPTALEAADLDADGDLDLVSLPREAASLALCFNDGAGGLGSVEQPLPVKPSAVAAADLDRDGDLDLVMASLRSLWILANVGAAGFEPAVERPVGVVLTRLQAVDLNGDGVRDLLGIGHDQSAWGIGVILNREDGEIPAPVFYRTGSCAMHLDAADADRDGDLDLVAVTHFPAILLRLNAGDGTLANSVGSRAYVIPGFERTRAAGVADLDRDGDLDVALLGANSGNLATILLNEGDWRFPAPIYNDPPGIVGAIAAGDFDGDGDADVAATASWGGGVMFYDNLDGEDLGPYRFLEVETGSSSMTAADLDADGWPDLTVAGVVVLRNRQGAFEPAANYCCGTDVRLIDLDGDGDLDFAAADPWERAPSIRIGLNRGDGAFEAQADTVLPGQALAAGDLDGDGDADLAGVQEGTQVIALYLNAGEASFSDGALLRVEDYSRALVALDLDGDRDLDLASGGYDSLEAFVNSGAAGFEPARRSDVGGSYTLATADFNLDGKGDLTAGGKATWRYYWGGVRVLESEGTGGFRSRAGGMGSTFGLADFDGDGRTDVVGAGSYPSADSLYSIAIYRNLTQPPTSPDGDRDGFPDECEGLSFHRGDFNDDGRTDITDGLRLLGFLFRGGALTGCLETADVQNDGRIDIADPVALLRFLFRGGGPPSAPGPAGAPCGQDVDPPSSERDLGCAAYAHCEE
jgi:hypothetical protein